MSSMQAYAYLISQGVNNEKAYEIIKICKNQDVLTFHDAVIIWQK